MTNVLQCLIILNDSKGRERQDTEYILIAFECDIYTKAI